MGNNFEKDKLLDDVCEYSYPMYVELYQIRNKKK